MAVEKTKTLNERMSMLHSIGHKFEKTIRGMVVKVKIEAPSGANVNPLLKKVAELFAFASEDPDQFGLFDEKQKGLGSGKGAAPIARDKKAARKEKK